MRTQTKNIAQYQLDYYESDDFIAEYVFHFLDDTEYVKDRIVEAVYDVYDMRITITQAEAVYEWITQQDLFELCTPMRNYWVGEGCIDSISFGEQEVQFSDLYNNTTGRPYGLDYLRRIFDKEGFVVNDNDCAYYDLSGEGVQLNIRSIPKETLMELLAVNASQEVGV